jgi:hypothetical protein
MLRYMKKKDCFIGVQCVHQYGANVSGEFSLAMPNYFPLEICHCSNSNTVDVVHTKFVQNVITSINIRKE